MKNNRLILRILFVTLAVLLVVYFTFFNERSESQYQWTETYESKSDQPYGTLFVQQLLASYRPAEKFIINETKPLHIVLDSSVITKKTDYVLIGQEIYLDSADLDALLQFIAAGNDAFISTINLPYGITNTVFVDECESIPYLRQGEEEKPQMNFYNTALQTDTGYTFVYHYKGKDLPYFWKVLNEEIFCDSTSSLIPLGYISPERVNFFKIEYGKGNVYVHTNPIVFTNYFMTQESKAEYASGVFSYLSGETIIWDEFSKSKFMAKNNAPDISPIAYLLQHESLRLAWWLLLAGALLYALFTAKRRQRVIPVLEGKTNTSLEFVNMISALHFQNANHHDIARKKMRYFYYWIRSKYSIHTQSLTDIQLKRLTEKSKINPDDMNVLAAELRKVEHQSFYNEANLVELHNALQNFYTHSR